MRAELGPAKSKISQRKMKSEGYAVKPQARFRAEFHHVSPGSWRGLAAIALQLGPGVRGCLPSPWWPTSNLLGQALRKSAKATAPKRLPRIPLAPSPCRGKLPRALPSCASLAEMRLPLAAGAHVRRGHGVRISVLQTQGLNKCRAAFYICLHTKGAKQSVTKTAARKHLCRSPCSCWRLDEDCSPLTLLGRTSAVLASTA